MPAWAGRHEVGRGQGSVGLCRPGNEAPWDRAACVGDETDELRGSGRPMSRSSCFAARQAETTEQVLDRCDRGSLGWIAGAAL